MMVICELCIRQERDGGCDLGLNVPKRMACREFVPGIERFCADSNDFVSPSQIVEMATYFGVAKAELKKVKIMAAQERILRAQVPSAI